MSPGSKEESSGKIRNILYNCVRSGMRKPDCYKSESVSFTAPITFFANFGELCYLTVTSVESPSLTSELQLVINKHLETFNVALIRKY